MNKILEPFTKRRYDKTCMYVAKKIVHFRDKEICQKCENCPRFRNPLHCSHNINDGTDTRLSVFSENMILLCYRCHIERRHKNTLEASEWFEGKYPGLKERLQEKRKSWIQSGSISDKRREDRLNELLQEYNTLTGESLTIKDLTLIKFTSKTVKNS